MTASQSSDDRHEHDDRRQVVAEPCVRQARLTRGPGAAGRAAVAPRHPIPPSAAVRASDAMRAAIVGAGQVVARAGAASPQGLADGRHELEVARLLAGVDVAGSRQIHVDDVGDPARAARS